MYRSCRLPLAIALLLSTCVPAFGGGTADGRLKLDGFGTLGAVYNDSGEAAFVRDITQPEGADKGWSGKIDSRLGLQATFRLDEDWTLTGQVVSRLTAQNDFDPELTWAFLRYSPDPGFQLRLGRVGLDSYMLSDSRDVGYSYLWVRPPVEYYGHRHFSFIDGADLTLTRPLGNGLAWAKVYGGLAQSDTSTRSMDDAVVEMEATGDIMGGHINYAVGPWHFQLSHSLIEYELEAPASYMASLRQIAVVTPNLAKALTDWTRPVEMKLSSAGLAYTNGPLQLQAMFNHMDQEVEAGTTDAAFITAGYRVGEVTPFLTWSESRTEGASYRDLGLPVEGAFGMSQRNFGMGLRFDFTGNAAVKAQLDRMDVEQSGLLWRDAELGWKGDVSLFSLSLDFVF